RVLCQESKGESVMSDELARQHLRRLDTLQEERQPYDKRWLQICEYILPNRSLLMGDSDKRGELTHNKVFDGTAIHALQLMANGILGYMVSPTYQWFKLKLLDRRLSMLRNVKQWLDEAQIALYGEFQQSNFYPSMGQYIMDSGAVGTATIYVGEELGASQLIFLVRHPKEIYVSSNFFGVVDTIYRDYKMTARNAASFFGTDKLSDQIQQALKDTPDKEFDFVHVIEPRKERNTGLISAVNKPWASLYIEKSETKIVKRGGYDSMPEIVWRWDVSSGEKYGRSPGTNAIKDVIVLNQVAKSLLIATQKLGDRPVQIPLEMRGKINRNPGGETYYEDANRLVEELAGAPNIPSGVDRETRLQEMIRNHFYVDFFLMLQQTTRTMTATEVIEKMGEKAAVLSAITGRFGSEALDKIIQRSFALAYKAGRIPPAPDEVMAWAEERGTAPEYEIEYMGPLAQAQRRLFKSQGITRGIESMIPIFNLYPDAADVFDFDEMIRILADSHGMPEKVLRDPKMIEQIRQAKARIMQEQQQLEAMDKAAGAVPKLGKAAEGGSILDQLLKAGNEVIPS
ncbi:MAG TPA: portal protein, partial [Acidobacteriota bacterium]|nr:portal protein [Acidobacteriota bacterium]